MRGANRQKRVASVTHSSQLLLLNPLAVPPTRRKRPPARRYPSRATRLLAPLEAGSLDGPKNEAANVLQVRGVIAAMSPPGRLSPSAHARDLRGSRATLPNPTGRSTRGHGAARLSPTRTFGLPPRARRQNGKSLFPAKTPYPEPSLVRLLRTRARAFRAEKSSRPLPAYPRRGRCARRIRSSRPRAPLRALPNHRVPRTHERSR